MALTQSSLASRIQSEIQAIYGAPSDAGKLQQFCTALAKAIVDELKANAEVTVLGVTPGGSSAVGKIT